ncbi:MAG: (Fe-S)-binding protein [Candidatus Helarchaeota archaeon]
MRSPEDDIDNKLRKIIPVLKYVIKDCASCGQCLQNCFLKSYEEQQAKKIMSAIKKYIESDFKKSLSDLAKTVIWRCCTDEYCANFCPNGLNKSMLMIGLRFILLQKGEGPFMLQLGENGLRRLLQKDRTFRLQRIAMRLFRHVNPMGELKSGRKAAKSDAKWGKSKRLIEQARNPKLDQIPKGSTLFMPGCGHTYGMPQLVELTMKILNKANVEYYTIGTPEFCCGGVFAIAGYLKASYILGERTGRALEKLQPSRVVTACPGCFSAYTTKKISFNRKGDSFSLPLSEILSGAGIEVIHLSQYFVELIREGKIEFIRQIKRPIAILDSCSTGGRAAALGKGNVSKFQHEILKSIPGVEYRQLPILNNRSRCCGVTTKLTEKVVSPFAILNADLAFQAQQKVITDAIAHNIRDLTLFCGGCALLYGDGLNRMGNPVKIWDTQELVAYAMGIHGVGKQKQDIAQHMNLTPPYLKIGFISGIPGLIKMASEAIKYAIRKK